jgi:hypothetical protein
MAWTYTTLKTAIQDTALNYETTFVANLDTFIYAAEDRLFHELDIPADKANLLGSTTASNRYLTAPTDAVTVGGIAVISSSIYYYLINKDVSWIREAFPNPSVTGRPQYYCWFDESTFLLGPTPDDSYSTQIDYYRKPTSIVTGATSWFGTTIPNALFYACMIEAAIFKMEDADVLEMYKTRYAEAIADAKRLVGRIDTTDDYRHGVTRP